MYMATTNQFNIIVLSSLLSTVNLEFAVILDSMHARIQY